MTTPIHDTETERPARPGNRRGAARRRPGTAGRPAVAVHDGRPSARGAPWSIARRGASGRSLWGAVWYGVSQPRRAVLQIRALSQNNGSSD